MPCVPAAGIQGGMLRRAADRLAGVDRVRAGRPRLSDLDRRLLGQVAEVPVLATAPPAIPPGQNIVMQTTGAEHADAQRRAAHAGAPAGSCSRAPAAAMIVVNDTGIYISNGQGATITLIGPTVAINLAALTVMGPMRERDAGTDFAHRGAVVTCAHGGQAIPTVPSPVVLVSGHADRDDRRALRGRRMRVRAAGRQRTVRDGQWVVGAMQVMSNGQPVAI